MKVFGTIFPFVEPNDQDFRMGRFIANYEFLSALLSYSHFDSYHLFCMNPEHLQATAKQLMEDPRLDNSVKPRIQLFLYSSLPEKLETEPYHVFHLGGWGYFFSGLAQLRNRYATHPFPITGVIHSLNAREARYDYYKLLKSPLSACDAVICTSEAGRETMKKQLTRIAELENCPPYRGQLPKIPLGVFPVALPDRQQSRKNLGISDDTVTLLYIGRLSPSTKADLYPLLLCFQQLLKQNLPPLKLILAGGAGNAEQNLHAEMIKELGLEQTVLLLANFTPEMKWQLYSAADISVAPSDNLQETFGISIIESMQAGLPVVAADLNGYRDLVEEGVTGYRIRTTWIDQLQLAEMDEIMSTDSLQALLAQAMVLDLEQMQQRLQTLVDTPTLRQDLGKAGQLRVQEQYLWPTVIKQYEELWQQLNQQVDQYDTKTPGPGLFSNNYLAGFSHYPSQIINEQISISLTNTGRTCLTTGQTPPIYSDVAMLLDQNWLATIMRRLNEGPDNQTIGELLKEYGDKNNRGRFSLLWAAKYGLLKLHAD